MRACPAWTPACLGGTLLLLLASLPAAANVDCTASASGVAYALYDPLRTSPADSTGTLTVTCSYSGSTAVQVHYVVALSQGASGTYAPRRMSGGAGRLDYNLYTDAARTRIWGNGSAGTLLVSGKFTLNSGNRTRRGTHTIYGRVPAQQDVVPGAYADSITMTLTF